MVLFREFLMILAKVEKLVINFVKNQDRSWRLYKIDKYSTILHIDDVKPISTCATKDI